MVMGKVRLIMFKVLIEKTLDIVNACHGLETSVVQNRSI